MKLEFVKPNVETSSDFAGTFFSVGDESLIFDILRNKLYSNPIASICREIACNARDAHREAKKADLPIEITLPNVLSPYYKIKDFGVGISPERVENIYVKYGASTKRNDNTLQGGYGLGAKVPLSYNSSFTIETIFNGRKYTYSCIIDETRVGKLIKLSDEITDQGNGTEIAIPVKNQDFLAFKKGTELATRHWPIKPIIKGDSFSYEKNKVFLQGKDWAIIDNFSQYQDNVKLIIDDIEYPLDIQEFRKLIPEKTLLTHATLRATLVLYFGIGDISLSASREQIHLDKKTLNALSNKIKSITDNFYEVVQNKINSMPDYLSANIFLHTVLNQYINYTKIEENISWNKLKLYKSPYLSMPEVAISYSNGAYGHYRYNSSEVFICKDYAIVLDDLDNESDAAKYVLPQKNRYYLKLKKDYTWDKVIAKYNLDALGVQFISKLPLKTDEPLIVNPKIDKISDRLIIFKFDPKELKFSQVPFKLMQEDKNKKIICNLKIDSYSHKKNIYTINNNHLINYETLSFINSNLKDKTSIYAIKKDLPKDKFKKNFSEFKTIDAVLTDLIKDNAKIDFDQIEYYRQHMHRYTHYRHYSHIIDRLDKKSDFYQNIKIILDMESYCNDHKSVYDSLSYIRKNLKCDNLTQWIKDNQDKNIDKIEDLLKKRYPMFSKIHSSYAGLEKTTEFLISYIKVEDKKK